MNKVPPDIPLSITPSVEDIFSIVTVLSANLAVPTTVVIPAGPIRNLSVPSVNTLK
jgi:hypothetical protein